VIGRAGYQFEVYTSFGGGGLEAFGDREHHGIAGEAGREVEDSVRRKGVVSRSAREGAGIREQVQTHISGDKLVLALVLVLVLDI
jgi:hypothetical protein